jgi:hypothetical protein
MVIGSDLHQIYVQLVDKEYINYYYCHYAINNMNHVAHLVIHNAQLVLHIKILL